MLEVLMLGILVSVVKLSAMVTVIPSIALWTFGLLIFFIAAILNNLNTEMLWGRISPKTQLLDKQNFKVGSQLTNCHNCHLLCTVLAKAGQFDPTCPRCNATVHLRKPQSLTRCTALLIAAYVMYIPANLLPVMTVTHMDNTEGDTIIGGVIYLATAGDLPLAIILFIASIFVPSIKLLILTLLLFTVHFKSQWRPKERTRLYRLTELIGRCEQAGKYQLPEQKFYWWNLATKKISELIIPAKKWKVSGGMKDNIQVGTGNHQTTRPTFQQLRIYLIIFCSTLLAYICYYSRKKLFCYYSKLTHLPIRNQRKAFMIAIKQANYPLACLILYQFVYQESYQANSNINSLKQFYSDQPEKLIALEKLFKKAYGIEKDNCEFNKGDANVLLTKSSKNSRLLEKDVLSEILQLNPKK